MMEELKVLVEALMMRAEPNDDIDPPVQVIEMLDACFTACRAVAFLAQPAISLNTDISVLDDVQSLFKALGGACPEQL